MACSFWALGYLNIHIRLRRRRKWCSSNCTPACGGVDCSRSLALLIAGTTLRRAPTERAPGATSKIDWDRIRERTMSSRKMTMGVIIGNRGFFPGELAKSGREEMIQALTKAGIDFVVLSP